ncbi:hypothetical protein PHJA_002331700 [Phtheirospermum japonicum]|uniref:Uncharacterized protein n=1 Tax=Phtheirospermum japonicum TaxID=374723 RepID=A0A830CRK2_9LAMI|nr:hypothetical protein PHJA_002331700 [Phtheirospermum japonicum]
MALSPLRSKNLHHHTRSLSLPSYLQHPTISQFNDNLAKITTTSSFSLLSTENRTLNGLKNLYCNIDDLLILPHVQHTISQESHEKWVVDGVVDAYIRLLDACTTAKDVISHTKHDVQHLLSALRRNDVNGIQSYQQTSRKNSKKMIQKALKDLKSLKSTKQSDLSMDKDQETLAVVYMIKEAESVTITMFENLLSRAISNNVQAKQSGWSLISKLIMSSKKVSHQCEETDHSSHLKDMESSIQNLEQELESLFRQLIKTRVFLLNILNH